ncbi:MAG: hypothetical protein GWP08_10380 [Nitrospiraceae bacterium]|nr:hypothetical protein [Nitrospiraceae bacterium]
MSDLAERVRDYLQRQIACFERILADLANLEKSLAGDDYDAAVRQRAAHSEETARLEAEFREIEAQWHGATGVSEAERVEMRALAEHAQLLADRLCVRYDEGAALVEQRAGNVQEELRELRRGRKVLDGYRPLHTLDPSFIDKRG